MSNEIRVGVMFITGLILLVLLIVTITRWGETRSTYTVTIHFTQVQGLQAGAAVRVAGVEVGRVTAVTLDPKTHQPLVIASINKGVPLYENYIYTIGVGGLVGERFVEIHGTGGPLGEQLPKNGTGVARGTTPADFDLLMSKSEQLVDQLTASAKALNSVVGSKENQHNLAQSLENLNRATASAATVSTSLNHLIASNTTGINASVANLNASTYSAVEFTHRLNDLLARNQQVVDQTVANLRKSSMNAEEFTGTMNQTLQRNQQAIDLIVANAGKATESTAALTATMNALLQRNQQSVDLIAANLAATSGDLRRLSETLSPQLEHTNIVQNMEIASQRAVQITDRLESIANAVNTLLNDQELASSVRESVSHLKQASVDLELMMAETREAIAPFPQVAANLEQASADLPKITHPFRDVAPETAQNLLVISRNFRETSEDISGAAHQVVKLGTVLRNVSVQSEASVLKLAQGPSSARSDFNFDVQGPRNMLRAGLADIGGHNQVNLELGTRIRDDSWFRYGLVQSSFGIGADLVPPSYANLRLTTELFDPMHLRANALAHLRVGPPDSAWWLTSGWYDLFSRPPYAPTFGVGVTFRPK